MIINIQLFLKKMTVYQPEYTGSGQVTIISASDNICDFYRYD